MATPEDYDWIDESILGEAATVTLARNRTARELLKAFRVDETSDPISADDMMDHYDRSLVGVARTAAGSFAIEPNGFAGSEQEVLEAIATEGTDVASVYWNVNGRALFSYALNGEVVTAFDPYQPDERWGTHHDLLGPLMEALPFPAPDVEQFDIWPVQVALALAEEITGVKVTERLVDEIDAYYPLQRQT